MLVLHLGRTSLAVLETFELPITDVFARWTYSPCIGRSIYYDVSMLQSYKRFVLIAKLSVRHIDWCLPDRQIPAHGIQSSTDNFGWNIPINFIA